MSEQYYEIAHYLLEVEMELRRLNFWEDTYPTPEALGSELPFCHDTLEFTQWLQFVFLQKMKMLLESSSTLPRICGITPYAEEYFKSTGKETQLLLEHLTAIDRLLTTN